jgi:OmpA-OmpF porin, OOP family
MFDRIVEQSAGRFGLGPDKGKQLVGMLVALIFNPKRGGPAGFTQAFHSHGLGDTVGSWLGRGPNQPITGPQLERVFGTETVTAMGAKLDVPPAAVSTAAAAMLPEVVNELSEHGDLPVTAAAMHESHKGWLSGVGDFGDFGHWGVVTDPGAATVGLGASAAGAADVSRRTTAASDSTRDRPSGGPGSADSRRAGVGRWLPWLLVALAVIAGLLLFRGCQRDMAATPADTSAAAGGATAALSARSA